MNESNEWCTCLQQMLKNWTVNTIRVLRLDVTLELDEYTRRIDCWYFGYSKRKAHGKTTRNLRTRDIKCIDVNGQFLNFVANVTHISFNIFILRVSIKFKTAVSPKLLRIIITYVHKFLFTLTHYYRLPKYFPLLTHSI